MKKIIGVAPAVVLWNPLYGENVGGVVRACSIFGIPQLVWTGDRVPLDTSKGQRLPREERMKDYRDVDMVHHDRPFDIYDGIGVPVAVEVRENAERLTEFDHPGNAVYFFGPENGSLPKPVLVNCHRFVVIPGRHCFNLAAAVNVVLYDRMAKRVATGREDHMVPGDYEGRGPIKDIDVFTGISRAVMGKVRSK